MIIVDIYIGDTSSRFRKLDQNFNLIWSLTIPGANFNAGSAILSNNNLIYIQTFTAGIIYCLDINGNQITNIDTPYIFGYAVPTIGLNGLIYIPTRFGLIAVGV